MRDLFRRHLTTGGRIVFVAAMVSALSILEPSRTHLDVIFVFAFSLLSVGLAAGLLFRRKIAVDWELPTQITRGETVIGTLHLRNVGNRTAYDLDATLTSLPAGLKQDSSGLIRSIDRLEPGESAKLSLVLQTTRRGAYTLGPLYVGTTFPFALWRLGLSTANRRRLLVTPKVHPIYRMDLDSGGRTLQGAVPLLGPTGESTEFVGVREYRQGDCLRKVHWKLWARRSIPVVREFSREQSSRLGIILDTYQPPNSDHFEATAEVAASFAHYLSRENTALDFFAAGSTVHSFSSYQGGSFLNPLMKLLCCLEPISDLPYPSLEAEVRPHLNNISTVLLITFNPTPERLSFINSLRQTGIPIRVYSVAEGNSNSETTYLGPDRLAECLETL